MTNSIATIMREALLLDAHVRRSPFQTPLADRQPSVFMFDPVKAMLDGRDETEMMGRIFSPYRPSLGGSVGAAVQVLPFERVIYLHDATGDYLAEERYDDFGAPAAPERRVPLQPDLGDDIASVLGSER